MSEGDDKIVPLPNPKVVDLWPAKLVCTCGHTEFEVLNERRDGLVHVTGLLCPACEAHIDLSR